MKAILAFMSAVCLFLPAFAQHADKARDQERILKLEERIARMEERIARMEARIAGLESGSGDAKDEKETAEQKKMMEVARKHRLEEQKIYKQEDIAKAEVLYEHAARNLSDRESKKWLDSLVSKYPQLNRAGCGQLYLAQREEGAEQERLFKDCILRFNNCYYGDGVQVGPYAMFELAWHYVRSGNQAAADQLFRRIRADYPDAVDHGGKLLVKQME